MRRSTNASVAKHTVVFGSSLAILLFCGGILYDCHPQGHRSLGKVCDTYDSSQAWSLVTCVGILVSFSATIYTYKSNADTNNAWIGDCCGKDNDQGGTKTYSNL